MRRAIIRIVGAALFACIVSLSYGLYVAHRDEAIVRASSGDSQAKPVGAGTMAVWECLAAATSIAVLVILTASEVAHRQKSRVVGALLIVGAPLLLIAVGIAAYLPSSQLIKQGWYINPGELALFWGVVCGGPIVIASEIVRSRTSR